MPEFTDYENVISVTGPLSSYHLYFNEKNITEKNVGKTNFKSKSNIYGVIDSINSLVSFEGHKEYKNGETTYSTLIELEGCSHYAYLEALPRVVNILNSFFKYPFIFFIISPCIIIIFL